MSTVVGRRTVAIVSEAVLLHEELRQKLENERVLVIDEEYQEFRSLVCDCYYDKPEPELFKDKKDWIAPRRSGYKHKLKRNRR